MAKFSHIYTVTCPSCGDGRVIKKGTRNGHQRFKCNACKKRFRIYLPFSTPSSKHEGRKFDSEQIGIAVRLYYSGVSYGQLAQTFRDLLGIKLPSKRTFYRWVSEFTDKASYILNDVKAQTGDKWVADEMYVKVGGRMLYHWNVMDAKTRFLLASHLDVNRDQAAAVKVFQKALAKADHPPTRIVTDKWTAYPGAIRRLVPGAKHIQSKGVHHYVNNNLSERMQGTFRSREKTLRGMATLESGQRFLDGFVINYNHFRDHSGIKARNPAEAAKINVPYTEWADIVRSDVVVPPEARTVIPRTRIGGVEPLPRDLTERKRLQRRKRRADRKAELAARKKKPKEPDGSVAMFNVKTLKPTPEFRKIAKQWKAGRDKSNRMHRSKVSSSQPVLSGLKSNARVVRDGLELRMNLDFPTPKEDSGQMHHKKVAAPKPELPYSKTKPKVAGDGLEARMNLPQTAPQGLRPKPPGSKR